MALSREQVQELRNITDDSKVRNYHLNRIANALEGIEALLREGRTSGGGRLGTPENPIEIDGGNF